MSRRRRKIDKVISSLRPYDPRKVVGLGSLARGADDTYRALDPVVVKETDEPFVDRPRASTVNATGLCFGGTGVYSSSFSRSDQHARLW